MKNILILGVALVSLAGSSAFAADCFEFTNDAPTQIGNETLGAVPGSVCVYLEDGITDAGESYEIVLKENITDELPIAILNSNKRISARCFKDFCDTFLTQSLDINGEKVREENSVKFGVSAQTGTGTVTIGTVGNEREYQIRRVRVPRRRR